MVTQSLELNNIYFIFNFHMCQNVNQFISAISFKINNVY